MEKVKVNVVLEPILGSENSINFSLFQKRIKKKINLQSGILVNNVCRKIMTTMGCGDLANHAQAVIFLPHSMSSNYDGIITDSKATIGSVKNIIGEPINIRISAKSNISNVVNAEKTICSDLIKLLVMKVPDIDSFITNPVVKDVIEAVNNSTITELSQETLINMQKTIEKELISPEFNQINGNVNEHYNESELKRTQTPIKMNSQNNLVSMKTIGEMSCLEEMHLLHSCNSPINKSRLRRKRLMSKVRKLFNNRLGFCKNENGFLNFWYSHNKHPSFSECEEYAEYLNVFSKRSTKTQITGSVIKNWFDKRNESENLPTLYQQINNTY